MKGIRFYRVDWSNLVLPSLGLLIIVIFTISDGCEKKYAHEERMKQIEKGEKVEPVPTESEAVDLSELGQFENMPI